MYKFLQLLNNHIRQQSILLRSMQTFKTSKIYRMYSNNEVFISVNSEKFVQIIKYFFQENLYVHRKKPLKILIGHENK